MKKWPDRVAIALALLAIAFMSYSIFLMFH